MTSALAQAVAAQNTRSSSGRAPSSPSSASAVDEPNRPQSPGQQLKLLYQQQQQQLRTTGPSPVGSLCSKLPRYVRNPPIEAVVFAWGVSEDAQLGLETDNNIVTPKVVDTLLGVQFSGRSFGRVPLIAGSRNTLGIDADGQVWSWGWNERGTLGHGHRGPERKPKRVLALKGVKVVQVALGGWHSLALSERGQIFAWGGNEYLQCGVEPGKRDIVSPVPVLPLAGLRIRMVACAGMHSLALTDTGAVWTWGEPWGDFALQVQRKPREVPGAVDIAAVACGAFHNMALTRGGEVYTWGTNDYGQLGNGNTSYQTKPCRVAELDHLRVADIAAGGWHSIALSEAGEVYIWGRGEYGRLGLGDRSGSSKLKPQKVRGLEGHKIVQASAGGTHSMTLASSGRMFIWGRGSFGRLGLPADKDVYSPMECLLPGGHDRWRVITVAAGGRHALCLAMPLRESAAPHSDVDEADEDSVGVHGGTNDDDAVGGSSNDDHPDGTSEPSLYDRDTMEERLQDFAPQTHDANTITYHNDNTVVTSNTHQSNSNHSQHTGPISSHSSSPRAGHFTDSFSQWPALGDSGDGGQPGVASAASNAAAAAAASAPAASGNGSCGFANLASTSADSAIGGIGEEAGQGGGSGGGRLHRGSSGSGGLPTGTHEHELGGASDEEMPVVDDDGESDEEDEDDADLQGEGLQGLRGERRHSFSRPMSPRPLPSTLQRVGSPLSMSPSGVRSPSHKYVT